MISAQLVLVMGSDCTHLPIRSRDPWLHPGDDFYKSLPFHSRFRGESPSGGAGCRETKRVTSSVDSLTVGFALIDEEEKKVNKVTPWFQ